MNSQELKIENGTPSGELSVIGSVCNSAGSVPVIANDRKSVICGIYRITSPTRRIYIGLSENCFQRMGLYKRGSCKQQVIVYRSIKKHGWDAHKFEIIHVCHPSELNYWEIYYSKLYNSHHPRYGMNIRECGGNRGKHSEKSKKKISAKLKGRKKGFPIWNKGLTNIYNEETLYEMGKGRRGKPSTFLGKKHSKESGDKMSKAQIGNTKALGFKHTREYCERKSIQLKGRPAKNRVKVVQLDMKGAFIKLWNSIAMADNSFKMGSRSITNCLQRNKISRGFKWDYESIYNLQKLKAA